MTLNASTQDRNPILDTAELIINADSNAVSETTAETATETAEQSSSSLRDLLLLRDFRLLWVGQAISLLGDQFFMIAMPWLVLQMTGDAFAMGTVMALGAIPRAAFMLLGGALTDRFTPRRIMFGSNIARMAMVGILAALVISDSISLGMLYGFSLLFGLADAFFFPASSAIVPHLVDKDHLQTANSIMQGTMQISLFAGPALAGIMIALLGGGETLESGETVADLTGIGIAFAIDAVTFIASAFTLWLMRDQTLNHAQDDDNTTVIDSIREGLNHVWQDRTVRMLFGLVAVGDFLIVGPMAVGIPVLADSRLPEGAAAFGILMSMLGGGFLLGIILAGTLPQPKPERLGLTLGFVWSLQGVGVALLGFSTVTPVAALILLLMSTANGYVVILFMTWLQKRTPEALLGRMMSVFMFSTMGLQPVALALAGAVIEVSLAGLFVGGGITMTAIVLWSLRYPTLRQMGIAPATVPADVASSG